MALAKARIYAGLATATGRPVPAMAATTTVSKPPVASSTMRFGLQHLETGYEVVEPAPVRETAKRSPLGRTDNIEAVLQYVDTAGGLVHGDPSLSDRARSAAPGVCSSKAPQ